MKKESYLEVVYDKLSFTSMEDARKFIGIEGKVKADILETGDDRPTFFTGELVIYDINDYKYSGVVLDIYIEKDKILFLIIKRLGYPQIHDVLVIDGGTSRLEAIFDAYAGGVHKLSKNELDITEIMDIVSYNTFDSVGGIHKAVVIAMEHNNDMVAALDELTDEENKPIIH